MSSFSPQGNNSIEGDIDVQLGAVEIKNGSSNTRATVNTSTSISESDNALAVKDPVLGVTTGTAVESDVAGTVQQYLRGLVKNFLVSGQGGRVKGNVSHGTTDGGAPVKIGGRYSASTVTLSDGQRGDAMLDANGNLKVTLGTTISGEDVTNDVLKVEQRNTILNCTADTLVKTGAGFLHTVTFSATGTSTAGWITLFDSTSETGTVIQQFYLPAALGAPVTITYDGSFGTGLYVGYGTSVSLIGVTVSYR